jgi:MarR family transcriptional regulator, transcriptional regulator for hemolysin
MTEQTSKAAPPPASHYPEGVAPVPVAGTPFLELQGRYPPGSAAEARFKLIRRILFLSRRWRTKVDEELRNAGQSHARWITLVWIKILDGKANHRELAERVGVELPTLIRLLNRLEEEGLVERTAAPSGGRAKAVLLTASGSQVLDQINALTEGVQASFFVGLDQGEIDACAGFLDAVVVNAGQG